MVFGVEYPVEPSGDLVPPILRQLGIDAADNGGLS